MDAFDWLDAQGTNEAHAVRDELAALRKDAERYRWLRAATEVDDTFLQRGPAGELDATIDAWMIAAPAVGAA